MQMIYSPSTKNEEALMKLINYDSEGNKINDKTWNDLSFTEKYDTLFKYNGGFGNVATRGISAGRFSLLSKLPDIYKSIYPKTPPTKDLRKIASQNLNSPKKSDILENVAEETKYVYDDVTGEIRRIEVDTSARTSVDIETKVNSDNIGSMLRNTDYFLDTSSKSIVDTKLRIDNYDEFVQIAKDRISEELDLKIVRFYEEGKRAWQKFKRFVGI